MRQERYESKMARYREVVWRVLEKLAKRGHTITGTLGNPTETKITFNGHLLHSFWEDSKIDRGIVITFNTANYETPQRFNESFGTFDVSNIAKRIEEMSTESSEETRKLQEANAIGFAARINKTFGVKSIISPCYILAEKGGNLKFVCQPPTITRDQARALLDTAKRTGII